MLRLGVLVLTLLALPMPNAPGNTEHLVRFVGVTANEIPSQEMTELLGELRKLMTNWDGGSLPHDGWEVWIGVVMENQEHVMLVRTIYNNYTEEAIQRFPIFDQGSPEMSARLIFDGIVKDAQRSKTVTLANTP